MGGAFNPPHLGHLLLAETAAEQFGYEKIVFIPTGNPPHKRIDRVDPGANVRVELVRAAIADNSRFDIDTFEVDRLLGGADRPSYTVETLQHLIGANVFGLERPGLILGSDAAAALNTWHQPETVLKLADVIVAARPGTDLGAVNRVFDELGAKAPRVVEMPHLEISSTAVRERVAAGQSIRYLVPERVRHIILTRGLYR